MALEAVRVEWRARPVAWHWAKALRALLKLASSLSARVSKQRWIRYRADLALVAASTEGATLTPIDEGIIRKIEAHADANHPDVRGALSYWKLGLRGGFVWMNGDEPLCMQWLFTEQDNATLTRLPAWSGMYQPLPPRGGQVEKLWAFSTARQKGVATHFAAAMFAKAKERGLTHLQTNICETNAPARKWADRTGWLADGTVTRYRFDLPGLRGDRAAVYIHASGMETDVSQPAGVITTYQTDVENRRAIRLVGP